MDGTQAESGAGPASERVKVRRSADRGRYDLADVTQILDAGLIAHVGVLTPDGPLVLPMAYGHDSENLYLHGAAANHLLGSGEGQEICVTVTCLDGLVVARTPFHNSMNYRSVVVRGKAERITDEQHKLTALKLVTDHIAEVWGQQSSALENRPSQDAGVADAADRIVGQGPQRRPHRRSRRHGRSLVGRRGAHLHAVRTTGRLSGPDRGCHPTRGNRADVGLQSRRPPTPQSRLTRRQICHAAHPARPGRIGEDGAWPAGTISRTDTAEPSAPAPAATTLKTSTASGACRWSTDRSRTGG